MKARLEVSEKNTLKKISKALGIPTNTIREPFLRIKGTNQATDADLSQFLELGIPIYQAIFALMKRHQLKDNMRYQVTFADLSKIFSELVSPGGLLNPEIEVKPRSCFSNAEATQIKSLLRQAKDLGRKERQDILLHLRDRYNFFTTTFTSSRSRFDDETFDFYVSEGEIVVKPI